MPPEDIKCSLTSTFSANVATARKPARSLGSLSSARGAVKDLVTKYLKPLWKKFSDSDPAEKVDIKHPVPSGLLLQSIRLDPNGVEAD